MKMKINQRQQLSVATATASGALMEESVLEAWSIRKENGGGV